MLDLETLGTHPVTAPIIQIGAVSFDLDGDGPVDQYQCFIDAGSNLREPFNRSINPETVKWWAETDPALLVEIMNGGATSLADALQGLAHWVRIATTTAVRREPAGVWGNGATFDITMLEMAYDQAGLRPPWHFRAIRDVRTMAMIAGDHDPCWTGGTITPLEASGKKHDAVVDCLRQVRMVQQTMRHKIARV